MEKESWRTKKCKHCGANQHLNGQDNDHKWVGECGCTQSINCPKHASANASESEPSWKEELKDLPFINIGHGVNQTLLEDFISSQFERLIEEVEDFDADNNHKLVKQLRKDWL